MIHSNDCSIIFICSFLAFIRKCLKRCSIKKLPRFVKQILQEENKNNVNEMKEIVRDEKGKVLSDMLKGAS